MDGPDLVCKAQNNWTTTPLSTVRSTLPTSAGHPRAPSTNLFNLSFYNNINLKTCLSLLPYYITKYEYQLSLMERSRFSENNFRSGVDSTKPFYNNLGCFLFFAAKMTVLSPALDLWTYKSRHWWLLPKWHICPFHPNKSQ